LARSLVATVGAVALAAGASPAYAKPCGAGVPAANGSAAVAQYVEQINTATGSCATGYGKAHVKPLKPAIQRKLTRQGGSDAPVLEQVATSSTYGAPQTSVGSETTRATRPTKARTHGKKTGGSRAAGTRSRVELPDVRTDATPSKALSAAANVVSDGSNGRLVGLALFLVAITVVALGVATYRQRRRT
jgi:hypothetical protein